MSQTLLLTSASSEIFIAIAAIIVVLVDLFLPSHHRRWLLNVSITVLLIAAYLSWQQIDYSRTVALYGFLIVSPMVAAMKVVIFIATAGVLAFCQPLLITQRCLNGDYLGLILFSTLGISVIIGAAHFLSLYLGLELMSLSLYALIGFRKQATATEAAVKYFILGALSSGLLLYGISLIYGGTGSLELMQINNILTTYTQDDYSSSNDAQTIALLGLVFVIAGIAFKLGVAPFHMWLPDVYQGAAAPTTLIIASTPKIAATALFIKILLQALPSLQSHWQPMLIILAITSLLVGNITALVQTNLKRLLAYSAIAHSGFVALAIIAGSANGAAAALFYISTYTIMSIGSFGVIVFLISRGGIDEQTQLTDMKGMAARNPLLAVTIAFLMFSMAGIPPMLGFFAKLVVLQAVINIGLTWLATFAVVLSLIGVFYYLRLVKLMFFEQPTAAISGRIVLRRSSNFLLVVICLLLIGGGIFPSGIITWFDEVAKQSFPL